MLLSAPPGLALLFKEEDSQVDTLFQSDTLLIRLLDDSRPLPFIFEQLTSLGDLKHIDMSFLNFSRSISASYYDTRDCVAVSAALQKLTGISSCIWRLGRDLSTEDRLVKFPLVLAGTESDWEAITKKLYNLVAEAGDVCHLDIEPNGLIVSVAFFDCRAKARLVAKIPSIVL